MQQMVLEQRGKVLMGVETHLVGKRREAAAQARQAGFSGQIELVGMVV